MKRYITPVGFSAICLLGFVGCETAKPQPQPTSLEIQAFQKQTVEASKKIAFAATMSVFQDLGYTIQSADFETGFITAQSPTNQGDNDENHLAAFFGVLGSMNYGGGYSSGGPAVATQVTRATAFIEELNPTQASIRLNFVNCTHSSTAYGQTSTKDKPVLNPTLYQNAFTKISEAIFIRQANAPSAGPVHAEAAPNTP